jgi:hypothetical protein
VEDGEFFEEKNTTHERIGHAQHDANTWGGDFFCRNNS